MQPADRNLRTVVIIGGVAGGASAAARLRRLSDDVEIVILERSGYVSFANCGLPYHLSATISDREDLLLQTPESLRARFQLDVRVRQEVTGIDRARRVLTVADLDAGTTAEQGYDALVLSPGAYPVRPDIPGSGRAQVLRDIEDLDRLIASLPGARSALVVGAGFIGLEAAENLRARDLDVTVVELGDQVLPPLDPEMAAPLADELAERGVHLELGTSVTALEPDKAVLADGRIVDAEVVLFAIGVRPETTLAAQAGLKLGPLGGIEVDDTMRTSDPRIWAVGDAVEKPDSVGGATMLTPLANIANRQGRRAADAIMGVPATLAPALGTAIVQVFGLTAACTGWNEKRLRAAGRDYLAIHTHPMAHASYFPGAEQLSVKLLLEPDTGRILGAQAVGRDGVDKRIDVIATAMRGQLSATDLIDLELAYAPPFGSAKDPINVLGYIAENRLSGMAPAVSARELPQWQAEGATLLDVRTEAENRDGSIPGSRCIPLDDLRDRAAELDGQQVIVYCAVGQRAHVAQQMLIARGIDCRTLDGGWLTWTRCPSSRPPVR